MEEKFIRNISIVCSVAGLALLFFVSRSIELKQTDIIQISYDDIGKNVKICGEVVSKFVSKTGHVFFKLKGETDGIDVVIFNNTAKKFNSNFDKEVCVTGTVDEYEGKLEIIAKNIQVR